jgi:tetratricopeptide (TPR) repeat protein
VMRRGHFAAEIEAALRLAPKLPAAFRMRARASRRKGRFDAAEQDLQKALSLNAADTLSLYALFSFYASRAEMQNAPPRFRQRAEALLPRLLPQASSANMQNGIAWHLGLWGRVDEALPLSLRSVEGDPACWECYDTLAMLVAKTGNFAKAVEIQSLAVNIMPEGVRENDVFVRLRDYKKAAAKASAPGTARGQLSDAVIRTIVQRRRDGYQRCYEDGCARDPKLAGHVTVRFVLDKDGTISGVTDDGSTLPNKQVIQCILDELAQLRFPPRESGEAQTVTYPFVFSAGDVEQTTPARP